jgi:hypothetical protein
MEEVLLATEVEARLTSDVVAPTSIGMSRRWRRPDAAAEA